MDVISKLFALGLIGAIGTIVLNKAGKQDMALIFDLALVVIALTIVYKHIKILFDTVSSMFGG